METKKQLFVNINVNVFLPKDVDSFILKKVSLNDTLDDEPETLEKHQFFVRLKYLNGYL